MKNNIAIIIIVTLVIGGAIGFFGGMQYQKNQRPQFTNAGFGTRGTSGAGGLRGRNGNGAAGTILSVDTNSITVKLADGSSKIVLLTASTSIDKATTAAVSDLIVGERVAAFGATNTDGSITATNVQLNPIMRNASGSGNPAGY